MIMVPVQKLVWSPALVPRLLFLIQRMVLLRLLFLIQRMVLLRLLFLIQRMVLLRLLFLTQRMVLLRRNGKSPYALNSLFSLGRRNHSTTIDTPHHHLSAGSE